MESWFFSLIGSLTITYNKNYREITGLIARYIVSVDLAYKSVDFIHALFSLFHVLSYLKVYKTISISLRSRCPFSNYLVSVSLC